jgi:DNA-directed RNA polymerase specialized sigma24 family protein
MQVTVLINDGRREGKVERELSSRISDTCPNPEQEISTSDFAERAATPVAELSPPLGEAFQMLEFNGMAFREMANLSG